jgi:pyridoxamine 5'-phosphate oxidase
MKILHDLRQNYLTSGIDENQIDPNPIKQFAKWFEEIQLVLKEDPNAFTLSTYSITEQKVRSRVVLLKEITEKGFVFFTNYQSAKGREVQNHHQVSMNFFWNILHRQVRVEGDISKISREESKNYFYSRPRESQFAALLSPQSEVIASYEEMEEKYKELTNKYHHKEVPFPENWGGYIIIPNYLEFWQGRNHRLHDRIFYRINAENFSHNNWTIGRLAP